MTSAVITSPMRISLRERLSSKRAAKLSFGAVAAEMDAFIIRFGVGVLRLATGFVDQAAEPGNGSRHPGCLLVERQHLRYRVGRRYRGGIDKDGIRALFQGCRGAFAVA